MSTTELNDRVAKAIAAHLGKKVPEPTKSLSDEAVAPAPKPPTALEYGHVWFSEVFDYKPKFGDFGVRVLDIPVDPEIARLIPSVDADYVLQKDEAALLVAARQVVVNHRWLSMCVLSLTDHSSASICLVM
jgi:hypothetical protein